MLSYNPYYETYLMHYGIKGRSGRKPEKGYAINRNQDTKKTNKTVEKAKQIVSTISKNPTVQKTVSKVQNSQYAKTAQKILNNHPQITQRAKEIAVDKLKDIDKRDAVHAGAVVAKAVVQYVDSKKEPSKARKVYNKIMGLSKKIVGSI